jgi:TolB protein
MNKTTKRLLLVLPLATLALAQGTDIVIRLVGGADKPVLAVTEFRGAGAAQAYMATFNKTLFDDLDSAGVFKMAAKSVFPLSIPQQPTDFRQPLAPRSATPAYGKDAPLPWLTDWANPPVNANYLAFGYTGEFEGKLMLFGWLFNVTQPDVANAQMLGQRYFGSMDDAGARKVAHEFASDILKKFGVEPLIGTKVYFVSNRSGSKEIWSMDWDGSNQKQLTFYKSISTMPSVSADGTRVAFTSFAGGNPSILIHSTETGRKIPFYNQVASMNATATFTPDGKQIIYSSTASGYPQLYSANTDGSGLKRLTNSRSIEVEPKINPKTGNEIAFVSGRSGPQQIYKMNTDGADVTRLTTGEGEASNPSWHPNGTHLAFSWTKGYDPGNFNIFIMDVATRDYVQLTRGAGRNENPNWAPDGRHIVFASNRGGSMQIYSMLADGTQIRQLTSSGRNEMPVWSK